MKLFLDANLLFSAPLGAAGTAQSLLVAAAGAGAQCICSKHAFAEAHRNLLGKAPQALARLEMISLLVDRVPEPTIAHIDAARNAGVAEKDAVVLGAALACAADWFVSGDQRHFGPLYGRKVESVLVLPLREAVDRLACKPRSRPARGPAK